jgi:cyclophilin family peptidyl-prolyl cis-trans isomerase/protein-disulfide isomerase
LTGKNKAAPTRPWWQEWQFWLMMAVLIIGIGAIWANQTSQNQPRVPSPTPTLHLAKAGLKTETPFILSGCSVESNVAPTTDPTQAALKSLFKPVNDGDWVLGPKEAAVTVMLYSDFQCNPCAQLAQVLTALQKDSPQDVRLVFRHFTLSNHDKATLAARAAEAGGLQGKFWEMHDRLMAQQAAWINLSPADFETWLTGQAASLKLDASQFSTDLKSGAVAQKVADAEQEGLRINLPGVPMMLINGILWQGPRDTNNLKTEVRLLLLEQKQVSGCPPTVIDVKKAYIATLQTNKGDILIQLYADKAPLAVNSFVFLTRRGWYDNVIFHTVIPGYMAQTGDPSGTGWGGPGYMIGDEVDPALKFDQPGRIAMVNSRTPDSNNSQFFITYNAQPDLDGKYTIFGQVLKGMDVVKNLISRDPAKAGPFSAADLINKVTIEEK